MRFSSETIHRERIKNAPYNPRTITPKNKKKLEANLKTVGLLQPLIFNNRTGNLVGGHQRLAILDTLEGTKDYLVPVCIVDLDEKTEKEQNVALNSESLMGDWDLPKLEALFTDESKIDFEKAGFDVGEIYQMFGEKPLIEHPEKLQKMAEQLRNMQNDYEHLVDLCSKRSIVDYYLVVVFKDDQTKAEFLDSLGLPQNNYVDGRELEELLKNGNGRAETQENQQAARATDETNP